MACPFSCSIQLTTITREFVPYLLRLHSRDFDIDIITVINVLFRF